MVTVTVTFHASLHGQPRLLGTPPRKPEVKKMPIEIRCPNCNTTTTFLRDHLNPGSVTENYVCPCGLRVWREKWADGAETVMVWNPIRRDWEYHPDFQ